MACLLILVGAGTPKATGRVTTRSHHSRHRLLSGCFRRPTSPVGLTVAREGGSPPTPSATPAPAACDPLAVDKGNAPPASTPSRSLVSLLAVYSATHMPLRTLQPPVSYDVVWIVYYLLWGAAAFTPPCSRSCACRSISVRLTPLRPGTAAAACLIAPGVRFAQEFETRRVVPSSPHGAFLLVVTVGGLGARRGVRPRVALRARGRTRRRSGQHQVNESAISAVCALLRVP